MPPKDTFRADVLGKLDRLERKINLLLALEKSMGAELDNLRNEVTENASVIGSAIALLNNISQMLKDAIAANDPAALNELAASLDRNSNDLAAAVAANTPGAPPPPAPTP
jgi:predicted transcriptional regulator